MHSQILLLSAVAFCAVDAHMSIWTKSMYGVGWKAYGAPNDFQYLGMHCLCYCSSLQLILSAAQQLVIQSRRLDPIGI